MCAHFGKNPVAAAERGSGGPTRRDCKENGDDDVDSANPEKLKKMHQKLQSYIVTERPNIQWSDVADPESAKEALQEAATHLLTGGKRKPCKAILLFGPSGTGKSYLAKALASEANNSTFISISCYDLVSSKWLGRSEKLRVRALFELARERSPAILFIDDVEFLCTTRSDDESESARRTKTELLMHMQGVNDGVFLLGATNKPWELDAAITRQFKKRIFIPLPEENVRRDIFKLNLANTPNELTERDFQELARRSENYSGAGISVVVREALMTPVRVLQSATHVKKIWAPSRDDPTKKADQLFYAPCSPSDSGAIEMTWMQMESNELLEPKVTMSDMVRSLSSTKPTVTDAELRKFKNWCDESRHENDRPLYCAKAKQTLSTYNLSPQNYEALDMDTMGDDDKMKVHLKELTGAASVPRVFIGGKFVGGDDIVALEKDGKLKNLLQNAGRMAV